jgi:hypothetical protein
MLVCGYREAAISAPVTSANNPGRVPDDSGRMEGRGRTAGLESRAIFGTLPDTIARGETGRRPAADRRGIATENRDSGKG